MQFGTDGLGAAMPLPTWATRPTACRTGSICATVCDFTTVLVRCGHCQDRSSARTRPTRESSARQNTGDQRRAGPRCAHLALLLSRVRRPAGIGRLGRVCDGRAASAATTRYAPSARALFASSAGGAAMRASPSATMTTRGARPRLGEGDIQIHLRSDCGVCRAHGRATSMRSRRSRAREHPQFAADRRSRCSSAAPRRRPCSRIHIAAAAHLCPATAIALALDCRALDRRGHVRLCDAIGSHFPPHGPITPISPGTYPTMWRRRARASAGRPPGRDSRSRESSDRRATRAARERESPRSRRGRRSRDDREPRVGAVARPGFTRHDYDLSIVAHAEPMDNDIDARDIITSDTRMRPSRR